MSTNGTGNRASRGFLTHAVAFGLVAGIGYNGVLWTAAFGIDFDLAIPAIVACGLLYVAVVTTGFAVRVPAPLSSPFVAAGVVMPAVAVPLFGSEAIVLAVTGLGIVTVGACLLAVFFVAPGDRGGPGSDAVMLE